MASGADRGAVIGMVMRQTLTPDGRGSDDRRWPCAVEQSAAERVFFGVSVSDPWTMGLAVLGLASAD